jgi:hypothetical protein
MTGVLSFLKQLYVHILRGLFAVYLLIFRLSHS